MRVSPLLALLIAGCGASDLGIRKVDVSTADASTPTDTHAPDEGATVEDARAPADQPAPAADDSVDAGTDEGDEERACITDRECGDLAGVCAEASCVQGRCEVATLADGVPCDDSDGCTAADRCAAGACTGQVVTTRPGCGLAPTCDEAVDAGELPFVLDGDTTVDGARFDARACPHALTSHGISSPERVVRFQAPTDGLYRFALADGEPRMDALLYLYEGCPSDEGARCVAFDDAFGPGGDELRVPMTAGRSIYVIVDGYGTATVAAGAFELTIERLGGYEFDCGDGTDDDSDGVMDCEDPDCGLVARCAPVNDSCELARTLDGELPLRATANTAHPALSHTTSGASCSGSLRSDAAPDLVYRFVAPTTARYRLLLDPALTNFDTQLYAASTCPPTTESCLGGGDEKGRGGEDVLFDLEEGAEVFVFVDGVGSTRPTAGGFGLRVEAVEVRCEDGEDDDGDGAVDCADTDCLSAEVCAAEGDACDEPLELSSTVPSQIEGSTRPVNVYNRFGATACGSGLKSENASDMVHRFVAPEAGRFAFELDPEGTAFDTQLYVLGSCPGAEGGCLGADNEGGSGGESVLVDLEADAAVFVVVDGVGTGTPTSGEYALRARRVEAECEDGGDEDGDGLTDCDDPDCERAVACVPEGELCGRPLMMPSQTSTTVVGNTDDAFHDYGRHNCDGGSNFVRSTGPDVVYAFDAPIAARYTFTLETTTSGFDSVLYVVRGCPPEPALCDGSADTVGRPEEVVSRLDEGERAWIFVDGFNEGDFGQFVLSVDFEPVEVDCEDGSDDDEDSLVDCADPDCDGARACAGEGDICELALPLSGVPPLTASGSTDAEGIHHNYRALQCDSSAGADLGKDVVYRLELSEAGRYRFSLDEQGTSYDSLLYVASTCPPTPESCLGQSHTFPSGGEVVTGTLDEPGEVFIFVDGWSTSAPKSGEYLLRVDRLELACSDGGDEDGDGLVDCADPDCKTHDPCRPKGDICGDPIVLNEAAPLVINDSTTRFNADHEPCQGSGPHFSPDVVYSWTPEVTGFYQLQLLPEGTDYDSTLYVATTCPTSEATCLGYQDAFASGGGGENVQVQLNGGEPALIFVDGWGTSAENQQSGAFQLRIDVIAQP